MMKNEKDSKQTRHIQRRVHFVRAARVDGTIQPNDNTEQTTSTCCQEYIVSKKNKCR